MERDDEIVMYNTGAGQLPSAELNAGHLLDTTYPAGCSINLDADHAWSNNSYLLPTNFGAATTASTASALGTSGPQNGQFLPVNDLDAHNPSSSLPQLELAVSQQMHAAPQIPAASSWPVWPPFTPAQTSGFLSPQSLDSCMSAATNAPVAEWCDPGNNAFHQASAADSPQDWPDQPRHSGRTGKRDDHATSTEKPKKSKSRKTTSTAVAEKKGRGNAKDSDVAFLPTPTSSSLQDSRKHGRKKSTSKADKSKSNKAGTKRSSASGLPDIHDEVSEEGRGMMAGYSAGKKHNLQSPAQTVSDVEDDDHEDDYEDEEHGEGASFEAQPTQRERNRMAATKCRAKTKAAIASLENEECNMSADWNELSRIKESLQSEALMLKNSVLAHVSVCTDCVDLQNYVRNAARHIGNTGGRNPIWGPDGAGAEWQEFDTRPTSSADWSSVPSAPARTKPKSGGRRKEKK